MPKMTTACKLTLGLLGGGSTGITYLFRDEFTTDAAAPLTSPRTAEPGPGTLTFVNDSSNVSVSGGKLLITNAGSRAVQVHSGNQTRAAGLAFILNGGVQSAAVAAGIEFGILNTSNTRIVYLSPRALNDYVSYNGDGVFVELQNLLGEPAADYAYILRSAGGFVFASVSGAWNLLWVDAVTTTTPVRFAAWPWTNSAANNVIEIAHFRVRQLPAPFDTDNGIATLNVTSPADTTEYTGNADGIIDMTVTAPGSLDGDPTTRCGFYYRADADLTPAWHCYVAGDGAFYLDSIASDGTRTNRITVAGVITGGATRTLRVIAAGTKHNAYTLTTSTWTKRGAEITLSLNDAVTRIIPSIPAGWTVANLRGYPRTSSTYAELDRS